MLKRLHIEAKIIEKLNQRALSKNLRQLNLNNKSIDFCSNDYLGFSKSLDIKSTQTSGATGSRLLSGNSEKFEALEAKIAKFHHAETGLIFNSGYDANIGIFSCIADKGDTIIYDQYIHASIRDGIRLSNARSFAFKHNKVEALEKKLIQASGTVLVVVESVYSMDGDLAPLEAIIELCEKYNAQIIVDEAHATGVVGEKGEGLVQSLKLESKVFARVHTFGKALGSHGAIILGSENLKQYLTNFAHSFIYTTALSEHCLNAVESAYTKLELSNKNIGQLKQNIRLFKSLLPESISSKLVESSSPIQCILLPGNKEIKRVEQQLQLKGINIRAILHPTVAKGRERLRICLHSFNTEQEIKAAVKSLVELIP
jgi:8-amino-7-oxononanoate synthase